MKRLALLCLMVGGCDALPRDPDGTLDRVRANGRIVVAYASPATPAAEKLIATVSQETGAAVRPRRGSLEPLIVDLNAGRVDLVIAEVSKQTPWKTLVARTPPLTIRGAGKERVELRALMRNGENRWIMLVERAARETAPATAQ